MKSTLAIQLKKSKIVKKQRTCISCGLFALKKGRYHNRECRRGFKFWLNITKSTLQALNAEHALLTFITRETILDVLPRHSKLISRFSCQRNKGETYIDSFKILILSIGKKWHESINKSHSRFKTIRGIRWSILGPKYYQRQLKSKYKNIPVSMQNKLNLCVSYL
jgi:hypothetical protein